jgi:hypothetical protein
MNNENGTNGNSGAGYAFRSQGDAGLVPGLPYGNTTNEDEDEVINEAGLGVEGDEGEDAEPGGSMTDDQQNVDFLDASDHSVEVNVPLQANLVNDIASARASLSTTYCEIKACVEELIRFQEEPFLVDPHQRSLDTLRNLLSDVRPNGQEYLTILNCSVERFAVDVPRLQNCSRN